MIISDLLLGMSPYTDKEVIQFTKNLDCKDIGLIDRETNNFKNMIFEILQVKDNQKAIEKLEDFRMRLFAIDKNHIFHPLMSL